MPTILEVGLWHGFDQAACIAVVSSSMGGLIVSAVLKYADSVLKGYATAASVILTGTLAGQTTLTPPSHPPCPRLSSGLLSWFFFGTSLDLHFVLGVINVTCSIALYSQACAYAILLLPSRHKLSLSCSSALYKRLLQVGVASQTMTPAQETEPLTRVA